MKYKKAEVYWDNAGDVSYAQAMFSSSLVERHINYRLSHIGVEIGKQMGLSRTSKILDLGCGDGELANMVLAEHFGSIDGIDLSPNAIERAAKYSPREDIQFFIQDITKMDYAALPKYDGVFLWGILHHVKESAPYILQSLRKITGRVIILEPNGNHIVRKLLEKTETYINAGEDSFRTAELKRIFENAGFSQLVWKRLNLFPNFTPTWIFKMFWGVEPLIEKIPLLRAMCTVNLWGFSSSLSSQHEINL
jgi:cyclopropane fatty-acyl-phospholipid synthase-like methyltransferase